MKNIIIYICMVALFGLSSCDSSKDNEDLEATRILYLQILYYLQSQDYYSQCLTSQTTALSCANQAGLGSVYVGALESVWSIVVAPPRDNTRICDALVEAAAFRSFSHGAKTCNFKCQHGYWTNAQNNNQCSLASYEQALVNSLSQINTCVSDCIKNATQFVY